MSFPQTVNSSRNHQASDLGETPKSPQAIPELSCETGRLARPLSDPCGVRLPDDQGSTALKVSSGSN